MPTNFTDDLRLAHVLADDADSLTTSRFKAQDLHVMNKPDLTPVTDADKSVERSVRYVVQSAAVLRIDSCHAGDPWRRDDARHQQVVAR